MLNPIKLALSQKNQLLETLSGDTSGWQASVEKSIQDDQNFLSDFSNWETMTAPIMSAVADRQAANKSLAGIAARRVAADKDSVGNHRAGRSNDRSNAGRN